MNANLRDRSDPADVDVRRHDEYAAPTPRNPKRRIRVTEVHDTAVRAVTLNGPTRGRTTTIRRTRFAHNDGHHDYRLLNAAPPRI